MTRVRHPSHRELHDRRPAVDATVLTVFNGARGDTVQSAAGKRQSR